MTTEGMPTWRIEFRAPGRKAETVTGGAPVHEDGFIEFCGDDGTEFLVPAGEVLHIRRVRAL